ncbi:hypothetical protein MRX96_002035 [Rhipicephalus microplus]
MPLTKGRLRAALGALLAYALVFDYAVYVWSPPAVLARGFPQTEPVADCTQLRLLLVADSRLAYAPGMSLWSWDDEWFVRRTYLAALEHVQPHAIAFLGDLFSEPPELSNETRQLRERFWSVFAPLNESTRPAAISVLNEEQDENGTQGAGPSTDKKRIPARPEENGSLKTVFGSSRSQPRPPPSSGSLLYADTSRRYPLAPRSFLSIPFADSPCKSNNPASAARGRGGSGAAGLRETGPSIGEGWR